MVRAVDTSIIHAIVYPEDEDKTLWRYRIPTVREDKEITRAGNGATSGGALVLDGGNQEVTALRLCMEKPVNFLDIKGEEVAWETAAFGCRHKGAPTEAYIGKIPVFVRTWLSGLIQSGASTTTEEAKNS